MLMSALDNCSNTQTAELRVTTIQYSIACVQMFILDCGKRCQDRHALEKHAVKHSKDKNFVCTVCGKRLKRQNSLDLHMRTHSGVRNYQCDMCDTSYFTGSALRYAKVEDVQVFIILLRNHKVNKHMEAKETFLCTFCGKGFTKKANLEAHITLHTGEKKYQCPHCEKRFRSHSVFQNHIRYHNVRHSGSSIERLQGNLPV